MVGDIFFFVSSIPVRHALSWWYGSFNLQDQDEADGNHPEPSIYGISEAEAEPGTSVYPAIVPHLPGLTQTTLAEEPQSILRGNSFDEGTEKQGGSFEKSNSKVDLAQTSGRTRRQGLQAGAMAIPASAPSIVRSGRRSDGNDESNTSLRSSLEGPKPHEPQIYRWQVNESSANAKAVLPHEIWHPPTSAYGEAADQDAQPNSSETRRSSNSRSHSSNSTLAESTPPPAEPANSEVDEWRLYAPFPSAYPPTPLPGPVKPLPGKSNIAVTIPRRSSDKVQFPAISEEHEESFGRSLQPPREPPNPGPDDDSSDDKISTTGVKNNDSSSDENGMDVDSDDDDDEEDDFDITLRTPRRQRVANLPFRRSQLNAIASTSSIASSESGALSTVAKGTTLRTRSSSESSSSMSLTDTDTDTSITPSRKTSIPEVGVSGARNSVRATEKSHAPQSRSAPGTKQANTSTSEVTSGQDKAPATKRRRAVPPSNVVSGSSTNLPPSVPAKDDAVGVRAATANLATITRGRGRGRGLPPSRSSSRIANSRLPPASSSLSPNIQIDTNTSSAAPPPRDRTIRNRK